MKNSLLRIILYAVSTFILSMLHPIPPSLEGYKNRASLFGFNFHMTLFFIYYMSPNSIFIVTFPSIIPPQQEYNTVLIVDCCWEVRCQDCPPRSIFTSACRYTSHPPLDFRVFEPPPNHFDCCIILGTFFSIVVYTLFFVAPNNSNKCRGCHQRHKRLNGG